HRLLSLALGGAPLLFARPGGGVELLADALLGGPGLFGLLELRCTAGGRRGADAAAAEGECQRNDGQDAAHVPIPEAPSRGAASSMYASRPLTQEVRGSWHYVVHGPGDPQAPAAGAAGARPARLLRVPLRAAAPA